MNSQSLSDEASHDVSTVRYESTLTLESRAMPGVTFTILRMSFARRTELARRVLELSQHLDFRHAGESLNDTLEANLLSYEIDQLYLRWGLLDINGLSIDGTGATPDTIGEKAPEELAREIVDAIKAQCGLSEAERKN